MKGKTFPFLAHFSHESGKIPRALADFWPHPANRTRLDGPLAEHVEKNVHPASTMHKNPFANLFIQGGRRFLPCTNVGVSAPVFVMNADTEGPTGPRPSPLYRGRENTLKKPGALALFVREAYGLSLLDYLAEICSCPATLIHRWIRTGQILLNGARVHPHTSLNRGDALTVPASLGRFAQGRIEP